MTLIVPHGAHSFVSAADGAVGLRDVLLPVDVTPRPQVALHVVGRLAQALGATPHVGVLHVGPPGATRFSMRCAATPPNACCAAWAARCSRSPKRTRSGVSLELRA
jgi:hypothetical protein